MPGLPRHRPYDQVQVQTYVTEFSSTFAELFLESVDYARDIVVGRAEKCDPLATNLGGGIGYIFGFPLMAGELGKSFGNGIAKYAVKKKELKRMKAILCGIPNGALEQDTFRRQVVQGAVQFFVAYELQLRQLIRQNSTNRLLVALDASARIFDYIHAQVLASGTFLFDFTTISKGIILGKSKREFSFRNVFKMRTRPGEMLDSKYSTTDLICKPGTVYGSRCVVPVKSKYAEFGYRLGFPFEIEDEASTGRRSWTLARLPLFTDWKNPELQELMDHAIKTVLNTLNDKMEECLQKLEAIMENQTQSSVSVETKLNYHSEVLEKMLQQLSLTAGSALRESQVTQHTIWFEVPEPVVSFTGREADLEKLHALITNQERMTIISQITSITGLGGIGKTQLASKYAQAYSQKFDGNVIWINSETLESTRDSFLRLTKELVINTANSNAGAELNAEVMKQLYEELGRIKVLIIFDNAEAYISDDHNFGIREYLPQNFCLSPSVRRPWILITSRNTRWGQGMSVMELSVLEEDDALQLILDTLGHQCNQENARSLCKALGRLPLALQQAIAYIQNLSETPIKSYSCPIAKYLEIFNENLGTVFFHEPDETGHNRDMYETSVSITWNITLAKIEQETNGARAIELMELIADYWSPDNIDLRHFTILMSTQDVNQSVLLLKKYSMVTCTGRTISVHRLVQKIIRANMDEARKRSVELMLNLVHYYEQYNYYVKNFGTQNFFANIYQCYCARVMNQLGRYQDARNICQQYSETENLYLYSQFRLELALALTGLQEFHDAEEILTSAMLQCVEIRNFSLIAMAIDYIERLFKTQNKTSELSLFWKSLIDREPGLKELEQKGYFQMRPDHESGGSNGILHQIPSG